MKTETIYHVREEFYALPFLTLQNKTKETFHPIRVPLLLKKPIQLKHTDDISLQSSVNLHILISSLLSRHDLCIYIFVTCRSMIEFETFT